MFRSGSSSELIRISLALPFYLTRSYIVGDSSFLGVVFAAAASARFASVSDFELAICLAFDTKLGSKFGGRRSAIVIDQI
jgi:hypothetical protein